MRIGINAAPLLSQRTGVGWYTHELAHRLIDHEAVDPWFFFGLRGASSLPEATRETQTHRMRSRITRYARRLPFSYSVRQHLSGRRFRTCASQAGIDLYHEPHWVPYATDLPTVLTIHDLSWLRFPETHPIERVRALNRWFEPALRRVAHVITDASSTQRELIRSFGVAPERTTVIPLAASSVFRPMTAEETAATLRQYGLQHGGYWLAVGTREPRKNLLATLRAFETLPSDHRETHPLVVVGAPGWANGEIDRTLERFVLAGTARRLGYVARSDLARLTAGAKAMVYPSLYEGFGLPPLEAMASAVPVVTSNASSLPEVVGDAGVLVEPDDVEALAAAMRRLADDPVERERLAKKGFARSRAFSWERCAEATIAVYARVLAER